MLFKETAAVRLLGLRIPVMLFVAPHVIELDGERVTLPVDVVATVPEKYGDEPAATFTMGLSLKKRT